jgi:hypothetical protein
MGHYERDTWELYHTETDRSELHDLAAAHPDRLGELVGLWFYEAGANNAFPLDDRSPLEIVTTPRPRLAPDRPRYVYRPGGAEIPESVAPNIRNRCYSIGALVPEPGAQGVLFAHGCRFGGHALYVKANRLITSTTSPASSSSTSTPPRTCPPARTFSSPPASPRKPKTRRASRTGP